MTTFRCPRAAVWLTRTLAAAVLVAAMLLSRRIYAGVEGTSWSSSRTLVVVVGVLLAFMIVRAGGRVRGAYSLTPDAVEIDFGKQRRVLPYEQIVAMTYDPPLVSRREWLPALVLVDRFGKHWRIPALLAEGELFVAGLIRSSGRDDLGSFASAHGLHAKMARTRWRLVWGYALAAAVVVAALWISLGGPAQ